MIPLVISPAIREKLRTKHKVQEQEMRECFLNFEGKYLMDSREDHNTDPPTLWFIGETYQGRELKIIFIHRNGNIYIKSAYEANKVAKRIYDKMNGNGE